MFFIFAVPIDGCWVLLRKGVWLITWNWNGIANDAVVGSDKLQLYSNKSGVAVKKCQHSTLCTTEYAIRSSGFLRHNWRVLKKADSCYKTKEVSSFRFMGILFITECLQFAGCLSCICLLHFFLLSNWCRCGVWFVYGGNKLFFIF